MVYFDQLEVDLLALQAVPAGDHDKGTLSHMSLTYIRLFRRFES
jgi:hypothetical protein